jgi:hypothetical protein
MGTRTEHTLVHKLQIDTNDYLKGSKATRKEINMAKREMRSMLTPAEKLEIKLEKLGELAKKDARFQSVYNEALKRGQKELAKTSQVMTKQTKSVVDLKGKLLGLVAAYASIESVRRVWAGINEQINTLDALGKQAQVTGASVEFLSRTQAIAARVSGLTAEQTSDAMFDMMEKMGEAAVGAGEGYSALKTQLGLTDKEIRKISAMRPEEMFETLRVKLKGAANEAERMSIANKIFGSNGKQLASVLALQNNEYQKQIELVKRLKQVRTTLEVAEAQKAKQNLEEAKAEIETLKRELALTAIPAVAETARVASGTLRVSRTNALSEFVGGAGDVLRGNIAGGLARSAGGVGIMDEAFLGKKLQRGTIGKNLGRTPAEIAAIQAAMKEGLEKERQAAIDARNTKQSKAVARGITEGVHALMGFGGRLGGQAQSFLGGVQVRRRADTPETEMQIRRDQSGPLSSVRGGSMEAFNLLNQVSSVRSVEVELAKTTAEKSVETVTLLEQAVELLAVNSPMRQKEYEEAHAL